MKRQRSSTEQPSSSKRWRARRARSLEPPECCKDTAVPLGRNRGADGSRASAARVGGGAGASKKAAPLPPPRSSTKDGVLSRAAAGANVPNKAPAAGHGHRGADTKVAESSSALPGSTVPAAGGLRDAGSQGAAGHTVKVREKGAGTGESQRKENALAPKERMVSAELLRCGSNAGSPLGRGSSEPRVPLKAVSARGGSVVSKGVVKDWGLEKGKDARKMHPLEAPTRHSSNGKASGSRLQSGEKSTSRNFAKDVNGLKKSSWSSCNVAAKSSAQGPSREPMKVKKVSETSRMNGVSSDVPPRMSSQSSMRRNKTVRAPGSVANPAKVTGKSEVKEKENEQGRHVARNGIVHTEKPTTDRVMEKRPMAQKNKLATNRVSFGPEKKGEVEASDDPPIELVDALSSKEIWDSKLVSKLKDDDVLKGAAISEGKLKLYTISERQHRVHNADARRKVMMIYRRFEFLCWVIKQGADQHSLSLNGAGGRIDTVAARAMKKMPDFCKPGPTAGKVPGVVVGDRFRYRVLLAIVGLHQRSWGGIDWIKDRNGTHTALSIVCSWEYPDKMPCSGELIYTGSGGKFAAKKHDGNQKLEGGNLALWNCISMKTPVRVIYGFKKDSLARDSHSRAREISRYIYDGLYHVVDFREGGERGSRMLEYTLKKIPGQPELRPDIVKEMMKSGM